MSDCEGVAELAPLVAEEDSGSEGLAELADPDEEGGGNDSDIEGLTSLSKSDCGTAFLHHTHTRIHTCACFDF